MISDALLGVFSICLIFSVFGIAIFFYMLPYFIADRRGHPEANLIFWINVLLGWSGIGWFCVFIWAILPPPNN